MNRESLSTQTEQDQQQRHQTAQHIAEQVAPAARQTLEEAGKRAYAGDHQFRLPTVSPVPLPRVNTTSRVW